MSSSSFLCWRQCGQAGSLLHMWWSCPVISPFWSIVSALSIELSRLPLTLTPELAILDSDLQGIPFLFKNLVHHILFAAILSIAKNRKTPLTPSLIELTRRINLSCHNELTLTPFNPFPDQKIRCMVDLDNIKILLLIQQATSGLSTQFSVQYFAKFSLMPSWTLFYDVSANLSISMHFCILSRFCYRLINTTAFTSFSR